MYAIRSYYDYFGIPDATGAIVNSVAEGSPAESAGLEPGDVVTHFDGVAIEGEAEEGNIDFGSQGRMVVAHNAAGKQTLCASCFNRADNVWGSTRSRIV